MNIKIKKKNINTKNQLNDKKKKMKAEKTLPFLTQDKDDVEF